MLYIILSMYVYQSRYQSHMVAGDCAIIIIMYSCSLSLKF